MQNFKISGVITLDPDDRYVEATPSCISFSTAEGHPRSRKRSPPRLLGPRSDLVTPGNSFELKFLFEIIQGWRNVKVSDSSHGEFHDVS